MYMTFESVTLFYSLRLSNRDRQQFKHTSARTQRPYLGFLKTLINISFFKINIIFEYVGVLPLNLYITYQGYILFYILTFIITKCLTSALRLFQALIRIAVWRNSSSFS